ncbi:hypothetical protein FMN50_07945 [Rhodobacterales bacterium]|nr:hypothetical protein FMN50_07945 [Rhodobacterales bacterium]
MFRLCRRLARTLARMIGAFLSNTPATVLRNNGVASGAPDAPEETSSGRASESARGSEASAHAAAARTSSGPVLTPQAVLALQDADGPATTSSRKDPSANPDADSTDVSSSSSATSEEAGGRAEADGGGGSTAAQADAEALPAPRAGAGEAGQGEEEDPDGDGLTEAEEKQVQKLRQRDMEVRAHEQAHARTGGAYAGAPSYTFQQGPDGKRYAVGGEVSIDTSSERTPEATARKMQIVLRAATAPADPSSQDLKVAQQARSQLAEAQAEMRRQSAEELSEDSEADEISPAAGAPDPQPSADDVSRQPNGEEAGESLTGGNDVGPASGDENSTRGDVTRDEEVVSAYRAALDRSREAQSLFSALIS